MIVIGFLVVVFRKRRSVVEGSADIDDLLNEDADEFDDPLLPA